MFLLIISLFLHYELFTCVIYEKRNFSEDSLIRRHHHNYLQISDFIKAARKRFHEDISLLKARDVRLENTRNESVHQSTVMSNSTWWWDNSSFMEQLGLNTPKTFFLPAVISRTRPSFPYFITPYTTEANDRHLNWDEIFPDQKSSLRSGSDVKSTFLNRSLVQSSSAPSLIYQNSSNYTFKSPILRIGSESDFINTISHPNVSLKDHSVSALISTLTTPKNFKMWLQEITMYTPVEKWLQTLANKSEMTPSYGYTTKSSTQVSRTPSNPQSSTPHELLKNDTKDQLSLIIREGPLQFVTPVDNEDYSTAAATTKSLFVIVNVSGIPHLSSVSEKMEGQIMVVNGIPTKGLDDAAMLLHGVQDPETPKSSNNSYHHSPELKISRRRQKYSHRYSKYSDHRKLKNKEENPVLRRMRQTIEGSRRISLSKQNLIQKKRKATPLFLKAVTRSSHKAKLIEPVNYPTPKSRFLTELDDAEDEKQNKVRKNKISVHHHKKDSLKAVKKKEKDKKRVEKEEIIRKIVEGSSYSYSDDEATLRKNLVGALRYRKQT